MDDAVHKPDDVRTSILVSRLQDHRLESVIRWYTTCPSMDTMSFHCLLVVVSLCGVLRDRPVMALAGVHAAVASWDGIETRQGLNSGWREADPLTRPFVHSNAAMAIAGLAEVAGCAIVADKMRHSRHRVFRDTWFLWQTVPTIAHIAGGSAWVRVR